MQVHQEPGWCKRKPPNPENDKACSHLTSVQKTRPRMAKSKSTLVCFRIYCRVFTFPQMMGNQPVSWPRWHRLVKWKLGSALLASSAKATFAWLSSARWRCSAPGGEPGDGECPNQAKSLSCHIELHQPQSSHLTHAATPFHPAKHWCSVLDGSVGDVNRTLFCALALPVTATTNL